MAMYMLQSQINSVLHFFFLLCAAVTIASSLVMPIPSVLILHTENMGCGSAIVKNCPYGFHYYTLHNNNVAIWGELTTLCHSNIYNSTLATGSKYLTT